MSSEGVNTFNRPDIQSGDRVRVIRDFDPPHPMRDTTHSEWEGVVTRVGLYGFTLGGSYHAWDPGPTCTQRVELIEGATP
jgi:hypothetical protein